MKIEYNINNNIYMRNKCELIMNLPQTKLLIKKVEYNGIIDGLLKKLIEQ